MSDLDDKEDFQIHRNAWVKEYGTKRGFNSHNYKRYGFATEGGLRRHIGRRESIRRDQGYMNHVSAYKHKIYNNYSFRTLFRTYVQKGWVCVLVYCDITYDM